ncbi:TlpA disulfide reductase family protein [Chitinophaga polysaccharea]|uniref:TlpA disulfide reductase family protein n=1 Tax=Chitinophaga polysaccharea TaxID=1293035 RepID=UPI0011583BAA|nr:TlpA disulfide reductase family protein [Chitinophaga polysaccharea]
MKKQIILPALVLLAVQTMAQNVVIKGTFAGDTKGNNKIYIYGTGVKTDSAVMTDGHFEFTLPFEKLFMPLFYTEYDLNMTGGYVPYALVVDQAGTITLSGGDIAKGMSSMKISGMKSAEAFSQWGERQDSVSRQVQEQLKKKFGDKWYTQDNPKIEEATKEYERLQRAGISSELENFVRSHSDSYASAVALNGVFSLLETSQLEKLYAMLAPQMQQTEEGKNIAKFMQGMKNSAIGSTVKDFTLNTPEEKPLSFSQLKGKYVLIDFWASWCGPCKQSFPHMKEIYKKYKSDKFEIYSISIDQDKKDWLKGLKEQELPWLQALDTKDISQSHFAVTGVPTTILIDPAGKILLKEVGFGGSDGPLDKKLRELFGTK